MLLEMLERQVAPDITVVELRGRLALGRESQRLEILVEELVKRGSRRVVLEMSGVEYIDSAGIGIVALAAGRLREAGGRLSVAAAPEGRVAQMLKVTQMDLIVKVAADSESAIASV